MAQRGAGLVDHLAETFVTTLARSAWTVATAESCTAGAIASRVAAVPGASAVLRGGIVAYLPAVKFELLSVTPGPVVTARAAREMAIAARELFHADVGLATTGVLGPAETEGQPVGTLWIGVSAAITWAQRHDLPVNDASEGGFGAALAMVTAGINHHVKEEETEIFPDLKSKLDRDELAELGDAIAAAKT